MKVKVILAAIALVASVGVVSAQNTTAQRKGNPAKSCYVDSNKDGVCDKSADGSCKVGKGQRNGKGKGQGLKDGSGKANGGRGANFVDANKNGVCDRLDSIKK